LTVPFKSINSVKLEKSNIDFFTLPKANTSFGTIKLQKSNIDFSRFPVSNT